MRLINRIYLAISILTLAGQSAITTVRADHVNYRIAGTALHSEKVSLYSMAVKGNYGFLGTSDGLQVVDLSVSPRMDYVITLPLGTERRIRISALTIDGDYLYATVWNGPPTWRASDSLQALVIVDISTPTAPVVISRARTSTRLLSDVYISGDFAYLVSANNILFSGALEVFDISNHQSPVARGLWSPDPMRFLTLSSIVVSGEMAYIAAQGATLIIDISNPDSLSLIGRHETEWDRMTIDLVVEDTLVYLSEPSAIQDFSNPGSSSSSFTIVNVGDPTAPGIISRKDSFSDSFGIDKVGDFVYLARTECGMEIIDVSDLTAPATVGSYLTPGYCTDVIADTADSHVFALDLLLPTTVFRNFPCAESAATVGFPAPPEIFQSIDVSDKTRPFLTSYYDANNFVSEVTIVDDYAYVLSSVEPESLRVLELFVFRDFGAVADTLAHVNSVPLPASGTDAIRNGNYLYITAGKAGLLTFNVTDPLNPLMVDSFDTPGFASGLHIDGVDLYVADGLNGLVVFDVSAPQNPVFVVQRDTPDDITGALNLSAAGGYLYVADGTGLVTFDIGAPQAPLLTDRFTQSNVQGISDVEILDGQIAINSELSIHILSLADSAKPSLQFTRDISNGLRHANPFDIEAQDGLLFVSIARGGLLIFDTAPDSLPVLVGQPLFGGFPMGLAVGKNAVGEDIVAVADRWRFVLLRRDIITDVDDEAPLKPESFVLGQNYPNPFNPSTTINFTLPQKTKVQLEIYNVLGQRIATLVDKIESVGEHSVVWNGTNSVGNPASSGVYFYRLTTGEITSSKSMILLK